MKTMEKFSLYDLLGLILPGALLAYFANTLLLLFLPDVILNIEIGKEVQIGAYFCFVLIMGAILYSSSFYLINKINWYNKIFGMYMHVADLYLELKFMHKQMNPVFNSKANEWFGKSAFHSLEEYTALENNEKENARKMQDDFYDRMYYELEYVQKNEHPKAFQCFYFFFRQTVLACLLLIALGLGLLIYSWLIGDVPDNSEYIKLAMFFVSLIFILFVSVALARWYRKRMVAKMYWTYFTHLNQNKK